MVADNWYTVSLNSVQDSMEVLSLLRLFNGNFTNAVMNIFPNIGLDRKKFQLRKKKTYDVEARRAFFDEFAKENGFDPLLPANWSGISKDRVLAKKDGHIVLAFYDRNLARALLHLYPTVGLSKSELGYWDSGSNRREFFDNFAKDRGFDPLRPDKWYLFSKEDVHRVEDGKVVLGYYEDSFIQALSQLYPKLRLDKNRFISQRKRNNFWADIKVRRRFFDGVAERNNIDPLIPENWYNLKNDIIFDQPGAKSILKYHNMSFGQALMDLYPAIGLDRSGFNS